ncbi:MAG: cytochrome c oxidase assembly protein [Oleispira antarctica]|uniref:Cytochrome c oxidase assembly protein CtaG n=1 Tax=Oleispira antarctica RB-8 TaxID=698738 RepID=R4YL39_OLEAN|nr:cytochrome c oxidase assembly protein [Oleispira antarctica]MBQ0791705.1 cytochrome c oxidase assembly protein [Oleispira antarctica]CCK75135.1 Cytochrome c oxidase assembly protein CtaG/Cox11 [Oleispira antarctica RB-8]
MNTKSHVQRKSPETRLIIKLVLFPCLMFGFGFLLIPLYDVFCDITGLNGKFDLSPSVIDAQSLIQSDTALSTQQQIESHQVILQFTAASDQQEIWKFQPAQSQLEINTGQQYKTYFTLHNPTNAVMEFTAIPSISPGLAAEFLIKTECFCFQKQVLQAGERVEMPLVFQLRNDTPKDYKKLTLAYRIYAAPYRSTAHVR